MKTNNSNKLLGNGSSRLTALVASAALFTVIPTLFAQSGTWNNTSGGTWSTAGNWAGSTVANGAGNSATFTNLDLTAPTTVTLDSARTLSDLNFGDSDTSTPNG
ncbi:MAG: hypothetical protein RLY20_551, partial [Verrucomicrobiota bacterium]